MTDQAQAAFTSASALTTQRISLAIGVVTASMAFIKDIIASAPKPAIRNLRYAWILYLLSTICGIWTIMAITGSLVSSTIPATPYSSNIKIPSSIQIALLILATFFMLLLAPGAMFSKNN
jgi:hypothetical protein